MGGTTSILFREGNRRGGSRLLDGSQLRGDVHHALPDEPADQNQSTVG